MSTYPQYILQSQDVYTFTINTLDTLPLHMPGAIQSRDLLRVLVFAAASNLSVHQACDQLARAPSGPTVLGTLADQLGDLEALEGLRHSPENVVGKLRRPGQIDLKASVPKLLRTQKDHHALGRELVLTRLDTDTHNYFSRQYCSMIRKCSRSLMPRLMRFCAVALRTSRWSASAPLPTPPGPRTQRPAWPDSSPGSGGAARWVWWYPTRSGPQSPSGA
jgi:hypothetical protein